MLIPDIRAGIEQKGDLLCFRVDPGQVRPFVTIAVGARQREIPLGVVPIMLARPDVLDMESHCRCSILRQPAVFATVVRPLSNKLANRGIHHSPVVSRKTRRAFACRIVTM